MQLCFFVDLAQALADQIVDSESSCWLLVNWIILVQRQCGSTFIGNLLQEEASELRHSEVAESDRGAYKGPLILLDTLEMHQANSMGQHLVDEFLVCCDQSFLACKLLLILLIFDWDQQMVHVKLISLKDSYEDFVVLFFEELVDEVAELKNVRSNLDENRLCTH